MRMKKTRTRLLGVVLAAVLLLTWMVPALALESERGSTAADSTTTTIPSTTTTVQGVSKIDDDDLPGLTSTEQPKPGQTPDARFNIWYADQVSVTLPSKTDYTASWGVSSVVSSAAENTTNPATIETLTTAQYLTIKLTPTDAAKQPLYGVYELVPFSFTGVTLTPAGIQEDADLNLEQLPYGTRLELKAEVQLTDSFNQPVAPPEAGTDVYGRTPQYEWSVSPAEYESVLGELQNSATVRVNTTAPSIVGLGNVLTYSCTVSGLPNPGNGSHSDSTEIGVWAPQMTVPPGLGTIRAEIGGEGFSVTLPWDGTVAEDADLSGLYMAGLNGGANHTALTPELGCVLTAAGAVLRIPQINGTENYKPGDRYSYNLQLRESKDGPALGDSVSISVELVAKAAKVSSVGAAPNAVAAGQKVTLTATVRDVEADVNYQWVQAAPAETPSWTPVPGDAASGTIKKDETAPAALSVYPLADMLYNLRLAPAADSTAASMAQEPAAAYVFTLEAKDNNRTPGVLTGLPTTLSAYWQPAGTDRGENAPTAPDTSPAVSWQPREYVVADSADNLQATVTLPNEQAAPLAVTASYEAESDVPSSVAFSVQPVVLETVNGTQAYTFPERVPTENPLALPIQWSGVPAGTEGVRIGWAVSEAPDGSKAVAPTTTVDADGSLSATNFTPDLAGTYKLKGTAYTGSSSPQQNAVGGEGVEITLVAEVVQAGQARIIPLGATTAAIGNPLRFQAQIANASGVYQAPTSVSAGSWEVVPPGGKPESITGSDNGVVTYSPKTAGSYSITYTPAAAGGIPATLTFTATDPQAPAVTPSITLAVMQGDQPAGASIAAGTNLAVEISVKGLPDDVTAVTGDLSVFGFGESPVNHYEIKTAEGAGSQRMTFMVPKDAQDGTPLRLGIKTAAADVAGVTIPTPAEDWTARVATSNLELTLNGSADATVNQPYTMMLTANKPLVADSIYWTLTGTDADYASSNGGTVLSFTPDKTGTVTVSVSAQTAAGQSEISTARIAVGSELKVALDGPKEVDVGKAVTVTAIPSTSAEILLTWELEPAYQYSVSGQSIVFTPDKTGTVQVKVSAALGTLGATDTLSVRVSDPEPSASPSASASPDSSASPSASASASAGASPSADTSSSPSAVPSASPSAGASGSAPTADNTMLRLRPDSNLRLTVRNSAYCVEGIKIVLKESQLTSAGELRNEFETPSRGYIRIANMRGETDKEADPIGTGAAVQLMTSDGQLQEEATVLVMGDVVGSGLLNIVQLVRMARDLNGSQVLLGVFRLAADLNGSGAVDISDLVREAQMLNGTL